MGRSGATLRALLVVATVLAAGPSAACQQEARRPTFVQVVDADGAPVVGAAVSFAGGAPHLSGALQSTDVVEVAADARGRAVGRLLAGRCYVAWATGPDDGDGPRSESAVTGFFAAGAMLELVCLPSQRGGAATFAGGDAWRHLGPLACYALTSVPGCERRVEVAVDGTCQLPPGPFDAFEVRLADGQPLWHTRAQARLDLPPPRALDVRAVDEDGAPLAGARVWHRVGRLSSWRLDGLRAVAEDRNRLLGTTDADGRCRVEVPCAGDPLRDAGDDLLVFVAADGRAPVAGGYWNRSWYVSDHKVPKIDGDELRFECPKVEPLVGRAPAAPAGTVAHLVATCKMFLQRNSYLHDARVFTAEVTADGAFAFGDLPDEVHSCRLSLVPPPGSDWQPPLFAPESRRVLPAEVAAQRGAPAAPIAAGAVSLQVLDARGGPARGAVAFVSAGDRQGILMRDSLVRVPLDERGAAALRLVPGRWVFVVVTQEGFGARSVDLGADDAEVEVRLALQPLARTVVTLRDAAGRPVEGARLRSRGTTTRGTNDPVLSILQGLRRASHVHWERLRTDVEGRVAIPFVPVEGLEQRLDLRWDGRESEPFALEPDAEIVVGETR